ncbi:hypothetical protein SAMN05444359_1573 [Neolewinella agarilytica]|uniref:Uncharacterized protein n=1 Tax=Neolewinella agarilytica TaxID=478744 RepID=A0A1H9PJE6_9BACT|nr:hypothetical protein SAMN05444359_1573 [Neolewinella agarilytica]
MLNNPISNIDPLGDTTRIFNLEGILQRTINDSHANQEHFLTTGALDILGQVGFLDADGQGIVSRALSSFFIGENTRSQIEEIVSISDGEGLERAFVLDLGSGSKELQALDITANRNRGPSHFDVPNQLYKLYPTAVISGHVHPKTGFKPDDPQALHIPSATGYGYGKDFVAHLRRSSRGFESSPLMIATFQGYNLYTSERYTKKINPRTKGFDVEVPVGRGNIYNYQGVKIIE